MKRIVVWVAALLALAAWGKPMRETSCEEWRFKMTGEERAAGAHVILDSAARAYSKRHGGKKVDLRAGDYAEFEHMIGAMCQAGAIEPVGVFGEATALDIFERFGP